MKATGEWWSLFCSQHEWHYLDIFDDYYRDITRQSHLQELKTQPCETLFVLLRILGVSPLLYISIRLLKQLPFSRLRFELAHFEVYTAPSHLIKCIFNIQCHNNAVLLRTSKPLFASDSFTSRSVVLSMWSTIECAFSTRIACLITPWHTHCILLVYCTKSSSTLFTAV